MLLKAVSGSTPEVLLEISGNLIKFLVFIKWLHFKICWCMSWSSLEPCLCKCATRLWAAFPTQLALQPGHIKQ